MKRSRNSLLEKLEERKAQRQIEGSDEPTLNKSENIFTTRRWHKASCITGKPSKEFQKYLEREGIDYRDLEPYKKLSKRRKSKS